MNVREWILFVLAGSSLAVASAACSGVSSDVGDGDDAGAGAGEAGTAADDGGTLGTGDSATSASDAAVGPCPNATMADYLTMGGCTETGDAGTVTYSFTSYSCTSTPSSICDALGANGANVHMKRDPKGPYTFLVGDTTLWNVTAGQSVDVVFRGTVYGATENQSWPHFELPDASREPGQTGDGTEENITTVACGSACQRNDGGSDILCSSSSPSTNCSDQQTIAPYAAYVGKFIAATADAPYPLAIEIKLDGGTDGSAAIYSVGTHLVP